MDFPKKQAQRLMPLYLLEYSEKLFTNHPNPEAPWSGDYTAGQGITITNNEISVDTNVIATKSDIPTNYVTLDTEQTIDGAKRFNSEIRVQDNTKNKVLFLNPLGVGSAEGAVGSLTKSLWMQASNDYGDAIFTWYNESTNTSSTYKLPHTHDPAGSAGPTNYTLAITDDIPSLDGYATEQWVQDQGYITNAALNNYVTTTQLTDALDDYALKTEIPTNVSQLNNDAGYATETWVQNQGYSKFSGSYNDLTDKPDLSIYAQSSNLSTVATTGSYNDLIDKPTIPTVNNPTITFTQGGTTKGTITLNQSGDQTIEFDAGSSLPDSPFLNVDDPQDQMFFSLDGSDYSWSKYVDLSATPNRMFHVNLSALNPVFKDGLTSTYNEQTNQLEVSLNASILHNFVTTDTNQKITGTKRFDPGTILIQRQSPFPISLAFMPEKFRFSVDDNVKEFYLPGNKPSGTSVTPAEYTLATTDDIPSTATSTSTSTVTPTTGTFVTGTSTNTTNVVNSVTYTPSSETLTFTYDDNTTASFTFLTSSTTVTSGTTSVVTSVTDSTSSAMTGATVSTSTTTTLS